MNETQRIQLFENHSFFRRAPTMPVDYTAYLLSSSPPGFEFYTLRDHLITIGSTNRVQGVASRRQNAHELRPVAIRANVNNNSRCDDVQSGNTDDSPATSPQGMTPTSPISIPSPCSPTSPSGKIKKKVSFADDLGLALTAVRIMTEPSNTPPLLRADILSSLTHGAKASVAVTPPPLALNFSQPASDYVVFRERLDKECVSLENVILKEYSMVGTIKVKNIAFEKRVFVRITFNSWKSFQDIPASFAPTNGWGTGSIYDTFSFKISVPTDISPREKVQFVVCYDVSGKQLWDNNQGANYEVTTSQYKEAMHDSAYTLDDKPREVTWSLYKNWTNLDDSVPYY